MGHGRRGPSAAPNPLVAALVGRHRRAHRLVERVLGGRATVRSVIGQHGEERQAPHASAFWQARPANPPRQDRERPMSSLRRRRQATRPKPPCDRSASTTSASNPSRLARSRARAISAGSCSASRQRTGHPEMRRQRHAWSRPVPAPRSSTVRGRVCARLQGFAQMVAEGGAHIRVAGAQVRRLACRQPVSGKSAHEGVLAGSPDGSREGEPAKQIRQPAGLIGPCRQACRMGPGPPPPSGAAVPGSSQSRAMASVTPLTSPVASTMPAEGWHRVAHRAPRRWRSPAGRAPSPRQKAMPYPLVERRQGEDVGAGITARRAPGAPARHAGGTRSPSPCRLISASIPARRKPYRAPGCRQCRAAAPGRRGVRQRQAGSGSPCAGSANRRRAAATVVRHRCRRADGFVTASTLRPRLQHGDALARHLEAAGDGRSCRMARRHHMAGECQRGAFAGQKFSRPCRRYPAFMGKRVMHQSDKVQAAGMRPRDIGHHAEGEPVDHHPPGRRGGGKEPPRRGQAFRGVGAG